MRIKNKKRTGFICAAVIVTMAAVLLLTNCGGDSEGNGTSLAEDSVLVPPEQISGEESQSIEEAESKEDAGAETQPSEASQDVAPRDDPETGPSMDGPVTEEDDTVITPDKDDPGQAPETAAADDESGSGSHSSASPTPRETPDPKPSHNPPAGNEGEAGSSILEDTARKVPTPSLEPSATPSEEEAPPSGSVIPDTGETDPQPPSSESTHFHTWATQNVKVKDAWEEEVLVTPAWEEQVLVKEAWDETTYRKVSYVVCSQCGRRYHTVEEINAHFAETEKNEDPDTWHGGYSVIRENEPDGVIHHEAEYKTVYHDAVYRIVVHEAEYREETYCTSCGSIK